MPQAGDYRVMVTNKVTGVFVGVYPIHTDGSKPPESVALENAVRDGRFENMDVAHLQAKCVIVGQQH